jgi:ribose transport system substrate-binding protein
MTANDTPQPRGSRRGYLATVATLATGALAGCSGTGGGGETTDDTATATPTETAMDDTATDTPTGTTEGDAGGDGGYTIGYETMGLGGDPWMGAFTNAAEWYGNDKEGFEVTVSNGQFDAQKQIEDIRQMLREDVDGIVVSPFRASALAGVVEEAVDEGVPVFTANTTAATDAVTMFTAFGNANAASTSAELMLDRLTERYGEARGEVVELLMPQENPTFVDRHEGFITRMDEEDGVEVIEQITINEASQASITTRLSTRLQQGTDFDAIYCPDLTSELGTLAALENTGNRVPRGEDGHLIMTGIDAGPNILSAIRDGVMDGSVDQPNMFYGPISIKYLVDYLDAGQDPSVLPSRGTEVTSDDLNIQGSEHRGVAVWSEPLWAPATVTTVSAGDSSHRYFKTSGVTVTGDNADSPYIWGNVMA